VEPPEHIPAFCQP